MEATESKTIEELVEEDVSEMMEADTAEENEADQSEGATDTVEEEEAEDHEDGAEEEGAEEEDEGLETDEEPTQLYSVKVDGKDEQVTLEELTQGYSRQSHFTRQMQDLSVQKQQFQEQLQIGQQELQNAQRQSEQILQFAQQVQESGFVQPPTPPNTELARTDPVAFVEQQANYQRGVQEYNQQQQQLQQMQQLQEQQNQAAFQQNIAREVEAIERIMPELADPARGEKFYDDITSYLGKQGFSEQEARIFDHRQMLIVDKARQFDELLAKPETVQNAVKKARPSVKPGSPKNTTPNKKKIEAARKRARSTGNIDDIVELDLLESK